MFKKFQMPVYVLIIKNVVPACLQCASHFSLQNMHPAGRQPDSNFIQLVAGRMQTNDKFGYFVLHGL
jgi:hypothetical protein